MKAENQITLEFPSRSSNESFARVAAAEAGEGTLFTALEDFLDVLAHWADVMQQGR